MSTRFVDVTDSFFLTPPNQPQEAGEVSRSVLAVQDD